MAFKVLAPFVALAAVAQAGLIKRVACPGSTHTAINAACCNWFNVLDDIQANLLEGECGEEAHESIRLIFHDSIGFSPALIAQGKFGGGGADGSIIAFDDIEQAQNPGNLGTADMAETQQALAQAHGVSFGDIIQFVGAVALTNCDGGPQLSFKAGRPNATAPVPEGLLPGPTDNIDVILARFGDAGFSAQEVVSLLASHTTGAQDHVDPSVHGSPFDSTPSSWDTQVFIEVQMRGTFFAGGGPNVGEVMAGLPGEMRLLSDHLLARDSATSCFWQALANDHDAMRSQFTAAMAKLSVLGQNEALLTDCSEVIPVPKPATVQPHIPAGLSQSDIEQACATAAFPILPVAPGPLATIPVVPAQ
jgi:cytochrome c peroxidase